MVHKITLFDINITNEKKSFILEYLFSSLENKSDPFYIVTPNPEMVVLAQSSPQFKAILNQARIAVCDGVGLYVASRVLGKPIQERITGVGLLLDLCKESVKIGKKGVRKPVSIGFLGGRGKVAEQAVKCLREKYPELSVNFVGPTWDDVGFQRALQLKTEYQNPKFQYKLEHYAKYGNAMNASIAQKHIDILFVAYGFPKQEEWMANNIGKLPVTVMVGVGGAFDYISGNVSRAPRFFRAIGLEWLYRLLRQPWRIKRQTALLLFIFLVIKEKLRI